MSWTCIDVHVIAIGLTVHVVKGQETVHMLMMRALSNPHYDAWGQVGCLRSQEKRDEKNPHCEAWGQGGCLRS